MFGKKKKFSLPANTKLVCISEEEYKNLLREEIALKLLTDAMRERNGCYEVPTHEVHAIGYAMTKHFDPTWEKAKQNSETIGDGKIILMKSAIAEAMEEKDGTQVCS